MTTSKKGKGGPKVPADGYGVQVRFDADTLAALSALAERKTKEAGGFPVTRQTDIIKRAVKELLEREARR
jgi:hypothetical protein